MPDLSILGWFVLVGLVLLVLSLFVAQAADRVRSQALFQTANAMTLLGALGVLIGAIGYWLSG